MPQARKDNLQGTLDLLVLQTLARQGTLHGYAISEHIHQASDDALRIEEGSLYPALHRMEEAGWLRSEWRTTANNRRGRYYRITAAGKRRLGDIQRDWRHHVAAVLRVLRPA